MKMIKKYFIINVFLSVLGIAQLEATEIPSQEQDPLLKQVKAQREERKQLFAQLEQENDHFVKFNNHLQEDVLAKGWFKGPTKEWQDRTIILGFEILEPYKNRAKYASNFDDFHSYISSRVCKAIHDYDKKCYFHLSDPNVCSEIITTLDKLVQYSISGRRIEPTLQNKLLFSDFRIFESQRLYDRLLQERK